MVSSLQLLMSFVFFVCCNQIHTNANELSLFTVFVNSLSDCLLFNVTKHKMCQSSRNDVVSFQFKADFPQFYNCEIILRNA